MPKYIDADNLKTILEERRDTATRVYGDLGGAVSGCIKILDQQPAANVEPVIYGQWVKTTGMAPPEFAGSYHCSECGWHGRSRKEREYKRCPECGAKMNEGER